MCFMFSCVFGRPETLLKYIVSIYEEEMALYFYAGFYQGLFFFIYLWAVSHHMISNVEMSFSPLLQMKARVMKPGGSI